MLYFSSIKETRLSSMCSGSAGDESAFLCSVDGHIRNIGVSEVIG